jgi:hypothetical protein
MTRRLSVLVVFVALVVVAAFTTYGRHATHDETTTGEGVESAGTRPVPSLSVRPNAKRAQAPPQTGRSDEDPFAGATATITGIVVTTDGRPVANARLGLVDASDPDANPNFAYWRAHRATTDELGRFVIEGLRPSDYLVGAQGPGIHVRTPVHVTAPATGVRIEALQLGEARATLVRPDGTPFSGEIRVWRAVAASIADEDDSAGRSAPRGVSMGTDVETMTILNGALTVVGLDRRKTAVHLQFGEFAPLELEVATPPGQVRDAGRFVLDPGRSIHGTVRDRDGLPISTATVSPSIDWHATRADDDGKFLLEHVPSGPFSGRVYADGFLPQEFPAVTDTTADVEIVLDRGARVTVVLKNLDGGLAHDASVFAHRIGADGKNADDELAPPIRDWLASALSTDEDGTVSLPLPAGHYRFVENAPNEDGDPPSLGEVTVADGESKEIVLTLPKR